MDQPPASLPPRILVVEDEFLIRLSAVALVEELGYEAIEAANADEAIAALEADPTIRIVFTDINMGSSMDGLALVAYARDRWPPLQFVVVSGEQRPGAAELPHSARFFPKPYDHDVVAETLQIMIGDRRPGR